MRPNGGCANADADGPYGGRAWDGGGYQCRCVLRWPVAEGIVYVGWWDCPGMMPNTKMRPSEPFGSTRHPGFEIAAINVGPRRGWRAKAALMVA